MNLDEYKLGNPTDDSGKNNIVSNCCGEEVEDDFLTYCCGARFWNGTDICEDCKEHSETSGEVFCVECGDECVEVTETEYKELRRDDKEEMDRDGEKDENN